jgi:hypothetical protein
VKVIDYINHTSRPGNLISWTETLLMLSFFHCGAYYLPCWIVNLPNSDWYTLLGLKTWKCNTLTIIYFSYLPIEEIEISSYLLHTKKNHGGRLGKPGQLKYYMIFGQTVGRAIFFSVWLTGGTFKLMWNSKSFRHQALQRMWKNWQLAEQLFSCNIFLMLLMCQCIVYSLSY